MTYNVNNTNPVAILDNTTFCISLYYPIKRKFNVDRKSFVPKLREMMKERNFLERVKMKIPHAYKDTKIFISVEKATFFDLHDEVLILLIKDIKKDYDAGILTIQAPQINLANLKKRKAYKKSYNPKMKLIVYSKGTSDFLRLKDLRNQLRCSTNTIINFIEAGKLKVRQCEISNGLLFDTIDVIRLIEDRDK